ncbi:MAG TPA: hypothetical protein VHL14_14920, partial [Steroidobacteraceae bacterium]|nr:hypothetical protein [Steroidobacteraceae bacterium]
LSFDGTTPNQLLPGQTLQGRLSLGGDTPALVLPAGAFLEHTGGDWIFILDSNGKAAHRRHIRIGRRNAEQIEVLSGINAGERAVISDYTGLEKIDRIDFK